MKKLQQEMKRGLEHLGETNKIRKVFWHMDEKVKKLRYGIQQGDDSVIVDKLVMNMEGPYPLKIGRKTGLIHTCSDIVVMGAKPLFAMNAMQVESIKQAQEISEDIKKQALGLGVPIIGGNTQMENLLQPCVSFTVVGKLINKEIPDAGALDDDKLVILGDVVEGEIGERVYRATTKFATYYELLEKKITIHASKDCSRGGWFGNLAEMLVKSRKGVNITSIPYPRLARYMGNYILSVPDKEVEKILEIAAKHKCPVSEIGEIIPETKILIGHKTVVTKKQMQKLIRDFPFRKARKLKK